VTWYIMWSREIDELGMLSNETQKAKRCNNAFKLVLVVTMTFILVSHI